MRATTKNKSRVDLVAKTVKKTTPLGERIRRLRQERRWNLQELGKRSSIATSTLSKVENGILSLAYDRLLLVAQAFDMSLSEFLANEGASDKAPLDAARISWARKGSGDQLDAGAYVYHYLCTNLRAKVMVPILSEVIARSVAEFGNLLSHDGEEFVFVVRGRVQVHTLYYEPEILEAGEGVYLDSRMGHAYTNASLTEPAWILSVNTAPILPAAQPEAPLRAQRRLRQKPA